jgi:outer membrane cobalamin receptor
MKISLSMETFSISQSSRGVRSKYLDRCNRHVALLACLLSVALTTLTQPSYIEAQTQTQTQTQTQNQNGQSPNASPTDVIAIPVVKTAITVSDNISEEAPANISVVSNQTLETYPGVSPDDQLLAIPGFRELRRTSGVVASATIQGVTLRGLGSSGASRTLVLWDGIPLNDPYGGWVTWERLSPENVGEVYILRGATTSVFGNLAMGGAVSIFSRPQEKNLLDLGQDGGSQGQLLSHATYTWLGDHFGFGVDARGFLTDGYYVIPEAFRGPIDGKAFDRFAGGSPTLDWFDNQNRFSLKMDFLFQHRNLGTGGPVNQESNALGELAGHYSRQMTHDNFSIAGYGQHEDWDADYGSTNAGRSVVTLDDLQHVPSDGAGGAGYWQHAETRWAVTAGADVEYATGFSHDTSPFTHTTTLKGGDLVEEGIFGQGQYRAGPFEFYGGFREQFSGIQGRDIAAPNGGVSYTRGLARIHGALNRGFRVPTLSELYRGYQQGNIIVLPNALLIPETMWGGEIGLDLRGKSRRFSVTGFKNALSNFIEQPDIKVTATEIFRERENVGSGVNQGVEAEVEQRFGHFLGSISYLYADTMLTSGPLAGFRPPWVPRHSGTAQVTYLLKGTMISSALRAYSYEFDDQNNQFVLPGYAVLQFAVSQHLWRDLSGTFDMENALDRYYEVQYIPVVNNGEPRVWRVGLRWNSRAR